jgi:hypothetical protein
MGSPGEGPGAFAGPTLLRARHKRAPPFGPPATPAAVLAEPAPADYARRELRPVIMKSLASATILAAGLLAVPVAAAPQQGKAPRIGVLSGNDPDNDTV